MHVMHTVQKGTALYRPYKARFEGIVSDISINERCICKYMILHKIAKTDLVLR